MGKKFFDDQQIRFWVAEETYEYGYIVTESHLKLSVIDLQGNMRKIDKYFCYYIDPIERWLYF